MGVREPLVSVIIPTFNRARLVQEAIASVTAQTGVSVEVLVVDDGSDDDTLMWLDRCGPPVVPLSIPHCGRIGRVRNAGLRHARGELLALLDSDDLWLPGKLRRQLDYLAAHPDIHFVYTNQYRMRDGRLLARTRFDEFPPRDRVRFRETVRGLCVHTSSVLLRRCVLDEVGLFDEEAILYEDADMWGRVSERFRLGFVETPLVVYRPDIDPNHLQTDERLNLREAWRYYQRYAIRRRQRQPDPGEGAGTARFLEDLCRIAAALGEPWPPPE